MTHKSKHTLSYCPLCETEMVRCATCNNNCCNGTYGPGPNGEVCGCPDCPGAYDDQDMYKKDPKSIEFAQVAKPTEEMLNWKRNLPRIGIEEWNEIFKKMGNNENFCID